MKRIDDRTVELTPEESVISDAREGLLSEGHSIPEALALIKASPELAQHLTPEFEEYLSQ